MSYLPFVTPNKMSSFIGSLFISAIGNYTCNKALCNALRWSTTPEIRKGIIKSIHKSSRKGIINTMKCFRMYMSVKYLHSIQFHNFVLCAVRNLSLSRASLLLSLVVVSISVSLIQFTNRQRKEIRFLVRLLVFIIII